MLARCLSTSLHGLEAKSVTEEDLAPSLPGIQLVGLDDKAIQESGEQMHSALRNSGFRGPLLRVVTAVLISWEITPLGLYLDRCRYDQWFSFHMRGASATNRAGA